MPTNCDSVSSEATCEATKGAAGNACSWYAPKSICYDADASKPKPNAASIWDAQVNCYGLCAGAAVSKGSECPTGTASFDSGLDNKYSGYGKAVGADTETVFNDGFYSKLAAVCTALDNVDARLFVDQRCLSYQLPLMESGAGGSKGSKGNTQIVVPCATEN